MIRKGYITKTKDNEGMQAIDGIALHGDEHSDIERFQNYGFSSVPLDDDGNGAAETVLLESHGVTVAVCADDRRFRPTALNQGDVIVYCSDDSTIGHRVLLKAGESPSTLITIGSSQIEMLPNGQINITASAQVHITSNVVFTGNVTIAGQTTITGNVATTGTLTNNGVNVGSTHKHLPSTTPPS